MTRKQQFNHSVFIAGWGALLIWWGISLVIDPITLGMCAIGTGLIMLAINAARMLNGVRTVRSTTIIGIMALTWGSLDQVRISLGLHEGVSYALMLMVIGFVLWLTLLFPAPEGESSA